MRVGVLALQGDFEVHASVLGELGVAAEPVRTAEELGRVDALVLPGGESTAMLKLMEPERLDALIGERVRRGMPVLATCAGVILVAATVVPQQPSLAVLDVDVVRNAYGRQVHSSVATIEVNGQLGGDPRMEAVFIRAPQIRRTGDDVEVLGRLDGAPVLVAAGPVVAATFHPELSPDRRVHRLFCDRAEGAHV
jgi:5'-phosphate synthase pdxT subunit